MSRARSNRSGVAIAVFFVPYVGGIGRNEIYDTVTAGRECQPADGSRISNKISPAETDGVHQKLRSSHDPNSGSCGLQEVQLNLVEALGVG